VGTQPLLYRWRLGLLWDDRLTAADRHVALTLALHMDIEGRQARPSITTLARETARKRNTVIASIKTLETCGWLSVKRGGIGSKKDVNRYIAKCPKGYLVSTPSGQQQVPQWVHELFKSSADGADLTAGRPAAGTTAANGVCDSCHLGGGSHVEGCELMGAAA
jgi:hypothetical protein